MKKNIYVAAVAVVLTSLLGGCSQKTYYQVYQTKPVDELCQVGIDAVTHDDGVCVISYNFFDQYGNAGFRIQNNSDSIIYVNLDETFFTLNGESFDYFQDRQWTTTKSQSTSMSYARSEEKMSKKQRRRAHNAETELYGSNAAAAGVTSSTTSATTSNERRVLVVPPHGAKYVSEYKINMLMLSICGMKETPSKGKPVGTVFTAENSPVTFCNHITYTVGVTGARRHIHDEFYVSEIMNVNGKAMIEEVRPKDVCGKEYGEKVERLRYNTADRFYVIYKR